MVGQILPRQLGGPGNGLLYFLCSFVRTKVEHSAVPLWDAWLIGGFVVQLVVGLVELREGNTTGGNVFTFFAGFFMLVGGLEFMVSISRHSRMAAGCTYRRVGLVNPGHRLITWTPAYFKSPLFMSVAVVCLMWLCRLSA
jgi:succinate-acetate transporter protein